MQTIREKTQFSRSVKSGVIRVAKQNNIHSEMDDQDLLLIAKQYAKSKAKYWAREKNLNKEKTLLFYRSEVKHAFSQLCEYRSFLIEREHAERLTRKRRHNDKTFVGEEQSEQYKTLRISEKESTKLTHIAMLIVSVVAVLMLVGLILNYTYLGNSIRESETQPAVVTIYARGEFNVTDVEIGRSKGYEKVHREPVNVNNSGQFEIKVDKIARGELLSVLVKGNGVVGCRIRLEGTGIVATDQAERGEVLCEARW